MMFFLFTSTGFSEEKKKIEGPIVITSQRLTTDNKAGTAVFEQSVVAQTTDMTLYADKMIVLYDEEGGGDVTKIDAEGNVKVVKGDKVITSQKASYFADTENVVFYGDPRAVEGDNVVTGSTMTYLMAEDRFLVENSKVFLKNTKKE
jgi:lipopolysaccharide export system protein LptA